MRTKSILFTSIEDDFIRANRSSMSNRELASRLGRPVRAIDSRARKLGIKKWAIRPFTPEEDAAIRNGFGGSSVNIARQLGRAPAVIRQHAVRLGLGKWKRPLKDYAGYRVSKIEQRDGVYRRIPEHRHIIEEYIGRQLTSIERVHHIDGRKRHNAIDNLFFCANDSAHHKAHHSITKLLSPLLERGIIRFDRTGGVYRLCEINK
jgi:hypothetical protein